MEVGNFRNFLQFRNFSQISAIFPQLLFGWSPLLVGALCVPCAEVLLLEASGGLVAAPQFSRNFSHFSQLYLTLPDRNHPPPRPSNPAVPRIVTSRGRSSATPS